MSLESDLLPEALQKYWGYDQFRPLQLPAMTAVMEHRDSLVVLPTGGGKCRVARVDDGFLDRARPHGGAGRR